MDFETLDFKEIRKICNIQPIEENKDLCKSISESFKQFCIKKRYDINIYILNWIDAVKELNKIKGHKNWVVPRKGTKSYKLAMETTKTKKPVTRKPMMTTKIMV